MFPLLEFDICRIFWKVLFLAVLIPFFGVSQLAENQDTTQIIAVQKVSSCPVTKEKWIEERKAKNCSSINVTLKYHCLLNHWRNQSFVLCGEDTDIIGFFCPEYDERRGKIQENHDLKCIQLNTSCPIKYNSSDVYKYTACINTNNNGTSNTPKKDNINGNILWFVALTVFIIVMIFLLFFLIRARLKRGYKCCTFKVYARPSFQGFKIETMRGYARASNENYELPPLLGLERTDGSSRTLDFTSIEELSELSDFTSTGGSLERTEGSSRNLVDTEDFTSIEGYSLHSCLEQTEGSSRTLDLPSIEELSELSDLPLIEELSELSDSGRTEGSSRTLGHSVYFSQPIEVIKKLHDLLIEYHLPTSDFSFATELLHCVNFHIIMFEVKSLSRKVTLNNTFETTTESHEPGKVCVAEVTVTCEKKQLIVKPKDSDDWERFLQDNRENQVRVILIHSKSLRVIEAKLKVYKEYKTVIDSGKIFLQHVYDDNEEISKLSAHSKMTWLCSVVQHLRNNLDCLNTILEEDMDRVLTEENILTPSQKTIVLSDFFYFPEISTLRENKEFILSTLERTLEELGSTIYSEISKHFESQIKMINLLELKLRIHRVLIHIFISKLSWSESKNMNVNSEEMRENVARDISSKKNDILKDVLSAIAATDDDLKNVSLKLNTATSELKLNDQIEAVKTWEKRENLQCLRGLESYPSVLKYIAGQKDNNPAIKVYLGHDDRGAMNFFKQNNQIPKKTCFEFVNVAEKSKEIFEAEKEHVDYSSFLNESRVRTELSEIINKHAEKLYAKYSSIVGLDAGSMYFEGKMQPCIIIYSLDKDLIPYGEDPLPKTIDGLHCHVREDLVMFGMCFDCRHICYPDPGCCIGVPSIGIGSAGFLVKLKDSKSPVTGFLTAAHVAARNLNDLYNRNVLLSTLVSSDCQDEIVHQLLPDNTQYQVIGKVRESFCGNLREGFGIDAAFVENSEPRQEEMRELQIADETNLLFTSSKVMKRGGATGETEGRLTGNTLSVRVDKDPNVGGFYYFSRCFSIDSSDGPFFEKGDSGSGVFLMENERPTKPLGIAFAKHMISQKTAVCRIDKIVEAFGLSVYQNEEPMEI